MAPYGADVYERTSLRQRSAIHESAHIARVLGRPVLRVGPRRTTYRALPRRECEFYRAALVTLSGPAAEDRFCGYTRDQRAELWNTAWREDLFNAMHRLDASGGGPMAPVKRGAERLVREQLGRNRAGGRGADRAR